MVPDAPLADRVSAYPAALQLGTGALGAGIAYVLACRITSYNVCYTKLLRIDLEIPAGSVTAVVGRDYPSPVVDLAASREAALAAWRATVQNARP